ncbi:MAG TPA: hypothetical protein VL172_18970 [Kofleriaceae bacterium]|nr:hypothetical protein [Kofleriaceae bacterium]
MDSDELAIQIARVERLAAGARERLDRIGQQVGELRRIIDGFEGADGTRARAPAQAEVSRG